MDEPTLVIINPLFTFPVSCRGFIKLATYDNTVSFVVQGSGLLPGHPFLRPHPITPHQNPEFPYLTSGVVSLTCTVEVLGSSTPFLVYSGGLPCLHEVGPSYLGVRSRRVDLRKHLEYRPSRN